MHNLKSLITQGLKEKSTYIGIGLLLFGIVFYDDIHTLIHKILTSDELVNRLCDIIATSLSTYLVLKKHIDNN